jgi:hypothetical protein
MAEQLLYNFFVVEVIYVDTRPHACLCVFLLPSAAQPGVEVEAANRMAFFRRLLGRADEVGAGGEGFQADKGEAKQPRAFGTDEAKAEFLANSKGRFSAAFIVALCRDTTPRERCYLRERAGGGPTVCVRTFDGRSIAVHLESKCGTISDVKRQLEREFGFYCWQLGLFATGQEEALGDELALGESPCDLFMLVKPGLVLHPNTAQTGTGLDIQDGGDGTITVKKGARAEGGNYASVLFNTPLVSGVHYFTALVKQRRFASGIGVAEEHMDLDSDIEYQPEFFGYYAGPTPRVRVRAATYRVDACELLPWTRHDMDGEGARPIDKPRGEDVEVGVLVDMDARTLQSYHSGRPTGPLVRGLPPRVFPVVCLGAGDIHVLQLRPGSSAIDAT